MMLRQIVFAFLLSSTVLAQSKGQSATPPLPAAAAEQPATSAPQDELTQMRSDLDHMESLLNNMSSEITFLRDQNLQILLNTNARMWTILIRDLRGQIDREQTRRARTPENPRPPQSSEPPIRPAPR